MADLTKHLLRARQALDKRNYDLCIEICDECQEVDPAKLEVYQLLIEAAKKKSREAGKSSNILGTMSMPVFSKDPHKQLSAAVKRVNKTPDMKSFAAAGDAAMKLAQTGAKAVNEVAILFYEEAKATGLFNADVLFNLGNLHFNKFKDSGDAVSLDRALKTITELERAKPDHPTASKLARDWQAANSMRVRTDKDKTTAGGSSGDFRSQVNSADATRKAEVMNRMIRTPEDAKEVLGFIEADLAANPGDKQMWVKKGDIHQRFQQFTEARTAFEAAQKIDVHDFVVIMRLGDVRMAEAKAAVEKVEQAGQDAAAAKQHLTQVEIEEFKRRVERQPTDMAHRFELAKRYMHSNQIELAAAELQQTVRDAKYKRESHFALGSCFAKKGLIDLAIGQFESCLKLFEDDQVDRAKLARYNRALLYEKSGKKPQAIEDYNRLIALDMAYKDVATRLAALSA